MNLKEMLKENNKFSQGRVYLAIAIAVYYFTQGIVLLAGMINLDVDKDILASVADAIEYPMTLFATYTLGGKAVDIFKSKDKVKENESKQVREPG